MRGAEICSTVAGAAHSDMERAGPVFAAHSGGQRGRLPGAEAGARDPGGL